MKIIGVGCGPGMLTDQAIREISRARIIFGSHRSIELARLHIPFDCVVKTIDDFKNLKKLPTDAIILSTGDPMLAGLGYLTGEVIPGISSLQVAAARLHIPIPRVSVVVAHGKGHEKGIEDTIEEIKAGKDCISPCRSKIQCEGSVFPPYPALPAPESRALRKSWLS